MPFKFLKFSPEGLRLYQEVGASRIRLRSCEEMHERQFDEESPNRRKAGLEYASAVQEYSKVVMAWLAWLEKYGGSPADAKSNSATNGA